jgi:hypothetical protein
LLVLTYRSAHDLLAVTVAWRYFCVTVEAALVGAICGLGIFFPDWGSRWFSAFEFSIRRISHKPLLSGFVLIVVLIVTRVVLLPIIPVPHPVIHDEFSYLLASDTFANGRITNPPHQFWQSFETVHILQQPTYMSMYPPVQGLFLALGQKVSGLPWAGVCVSMGAMILSIFWMLRGWVSPPWAFVAAFLITIRWGLFSYWMNSYWGGAPAATAGALVLGSLPRLARRVRLRDSLALGLGFSLLANSRPYEGLLVASAAIAAFAIALFRQGWLSRLLRWRVVVPVCLVLSCSAASAFYYNWRITGSALKVPYVSDREQYATTPLFLILPLRPEPVYRDEGLRRVYAAEVTLYRKARAMWGLREIGRKLKDFWLFFFGPLLTIPVLVLLFTRSDPPDERKQFFLYIVGVTVAGLLIEVWFYPHYASPATAAIVSVIVLGFQRLRALRWRQREIGLFMSRAIPLGCLLLCFIPLTTAFLGLHLDSFPLQWYGGNPEPMRSSPAFASLAADGRNDLVFVRYSAIHRVENEWVYNSADIDRSSVVWARDKGCVENIKLIQYFSGRRIWLFEADMQPLRLLPYGSLPGVVGRSPDCLAGGFDR